MTEKKNTRVKNNNVEIKKQDPSFKEALDEKDEKENLANESLELKKNYQNLISEYRDKVKKFNELFSKYGYDLDLKELFHIAKYNGYKAEAISTALNLFDKIVSNKLQEIELTSLKVEKGYIQDTYTTDTFKVKRSEVVEKINEGDIDFYKYAINNLNFNYLEKSINEDTVYAKNFLGYYFDNFKSETRREYPSYLDYKQKLHNLVQNVKDNIKQSESHFIQNNNELFEPYLLESLKSTGLSLKELLKTAKEMTSFFSEIDNLRLEIAKLSSIEVAKGIENDQIICNNKDQDLNINNIRYLSQISGESDINAPQEIPLESDLFYHYIHHLYQCEFNELERVNKASSWSLLIHLKEQIINECTKAKVKEWNNKYDNVKSPSTAVSIVEDKEEKCNKLESNVKTLEKNLLHVFYYKTKEDDIILDSLKAINTKLVITEEGEVTIDGENIVPESTKNARNLLGFGDIHEKIADAAESSVAEYLENGKVEGVQIHNDMLIGVNSNTSDMQHSEQL